MKSFNLYLLSFIGLCFGSNSLNLLLSSFSISNTFLFKPVKSETIFLSFDSLDDFEKASRKHLGKDFPKDLKVPRFEPSDFIK